MQYTFRCILDVKDDVIRDITINASANLLELHEAIVQAFGLSLGEMAAFYQTNNDWDQGEEIPLFDMSDAGVSNEMKDYSLSDIFKNTSDKILYVYDFLSMWTFFIELNKKEANKNIDTPMMVFSVGKLPKQAPEKQFISDKIPDEFEDDFDDEFEDGYDTDEDYSNYY
jgi:hypothetical protein